MITKLELTFAPHEMIQMEIIQKSDNLRRSIVQLAAFIEIQLGREDLTEIEMQIYHKLSQKLKEACIAESISHLI